jgi:hypothetical protein
MQKVKTGKSKVPPRRTGLAKQMKWLAKQKVGTYFDWNIERQNTLHGVATKVFGGSGHIAVRGQDKGVFRVWRLK